ncbi:MAG TPA: LegC family aminotransferase [Bacteroidales bacterium]|nr:LegC family aminotransferase [Bacteroidales bacterium]
MFENIIKFIRKIFNTETGFIPLHEPRFIGKEKEYLINCIDSNYVSSIGKYVDLFEQKFKEYTGAKYAVVTTNGTSALHMALILAGVKANELVITQPLTFIATCNAIAYTGAHPLFIDVEYKTLGLSADKLNTFLKSNTYKNNDGSSYHKSTGKRIAACLPVHTFGHPTEIEDIKKICNSYNIPLIEDAAESIGSTYNNVHTGRFGLIGVFSFNGNKTITSGGGGMLITDDDKIGKLAKHLTTQAKIPHRWEFSHDYIGYNYRLPNINAALACAQMENLNTFIQNKRELAALYKNFFSTTPYIYVDEPPHAKSNFWLNCILMRNRKERDEFLEYSNNNGVMTRPAWTLMNKLPMFANCIIDNISNAIDIENRLVNIPSSVRIK